MAVRFDSHAPTSKVHREVAERLNSERFRTFAFFKEQPDDLPCNITPVMLPVWGTSLKPISTFVKAVKITPKLLSSSIDIIQTIVNPYFLPLQQLSKLKGKHVITLHGVPETKKLFYIGKILSNHASKIVSVSNYTAQKIKQYYGVDSQVIRNGVNSNFFHPVKHNNDRVKIVFVGRLISWKRPQWVAKLAKCFPNCDFIIHGRGLMESSLKTFNLPNLTVDSSFVSNEKLRDLYAKSDIFLFPSTDWCSLVSLEAMACGVPLLLNSVGGQAEFIEDGREGLLAKTFDETKEKLQYLIEDENVRRDMGGEARRTALKSNWLYATRKYELLYEEAASYG